MTENFNFVELAGKLDFCGFGEKIIFFFDEKTHFEVWPKNLFYGFYQKTRFLVLLKNSFEGLVRILIFRGGENIKFCIIEQN